MWDPDEDLLVEFDRALHGLETERIDRLRDSYGSEIVNAWLNSAVDRRLLIERNGVFSITPSGHRLIQERFPGVVEVQLPAE